MDSAYGTATGLLALTLKVNRRPGELSDTTAGQRVKRTTVGGDAATQPSPAQLCAPGRSAARDKRAGLGASGAWAGRGMVGPGGAWGAGGEELPLPGLRPRDQARHRARGGVAGGGAGIDG
jgi:hypothetical protein